MRKAGRGGETEKGWVSYGEVWYQLPGCSVSLAPPPCLCSTGSSGDQWCPHPCWWRGTGEGVGWSVWKKLGAMRCHPELLTLLGRFARHWQDMAKQNLPGRCQPKLTSPSLSPCFSCATALNTLWCPPVWSCRLGEPEGRLRTPRGKGGREYCPSRTCPALPSALWQHSRESGKWRQRCRRICYSLLAVDIGLPSDSECLKAMPGAALCHPWIKFWHSVFGQQNWVMPAFFGCFFLKWQAARLQNKSILSINSILLERSSWAVSHNFICLHSLPCRDIKGVSRRWKHSTPGPLLFFFPFLGWSKSRHYLLGIPPKGVWHVLAVVRPMNTCIRESEKYVVPKEAWALAWPVAPWSWWILRYVLKSG